MITILDKTLKDAGISFADAVALLAPGDELVVHVSQILDAPTIPPAAPIGLDDGLTTLDNEAIPLRVISESATDHASAERVNAVFTGETSVLHGGGGLRQGVQRKWDLGMTPIHHPTPQSR